jgi:O-acetyl-ADP-ribose deacetylase (regulator of RNase III)
MLTFETGDLFDQDVKAIGHGVNCQGLMGAGLAVSFRNRYTKMFGHYQDLCAHQGLYPGSVLAWYDPPTDQFIYNLASQRLPGKNAQTDWLRASLAKMYAHAYYFGVDSIALPWVGCGIGGLNTTQVRAVFKEMSETPVGKDIKLVIVTRG